jgi:hypothetical protein
MPLPNLWQSSLHHHVVYIYKFCSGWYGDSELTQDKLIMPFSCYPEAQQLHMSNLLLGLSSYQLENVWQWCKSLFQPNLSFFFHELEQTSVGPQGIFEWICPETFLSGDAFPQKWNLSLTTHHLVDLHLHNILHSNDVSPKEMVTYLSVMPILGTWSLVSQQPFNASALLTLIKRLVVLDARWIPRARGCSFYIRPTIIGTWPSLGVSASFHAAL